MSKKHKKFKNRYSNQTELGKRFGLSAIAVGKVLIEHGLKDSVTKHATRRALDEGYAVSTPLKDGTPYFMWDVAKVRSVLFEKHKPLPKVDFWLSHVESIYAKVVKANEEGHKLAYMIVNSMYDDVPRDVLVEVKAKFESKHKMDEEDSPMFPEE
jgi:hypothetical protein